jgi:hypothetical protein
VDGGAADHDGGDAVAVFVAGRLRRARRRSARSRSVGRGLGSARRFAVGANGSGRLPVHEKVEKGKRIIGVKEA